MNKVWLSFLFLDVWTRSNCRDHQYHLTGSVGTSPPSKQFFWTARTSFSILFFNQSLKSQRNNCIYVLTFTRSFTTLNFYKKQPDFVLKEPEGPAVVHGRQLTDFQSEEASQLPSGLILIKRIAAALCYTLVRYTLNHRGLRPDQWSFQSLSSGPMWAVDDLNLLSRCGSSEDEIQQECHSAN